MAKKKSSSDSVDIKKKVTSAVSGLGKPKRTESGGYIVFTASWKYPSSCFDKKQEDRFAGVLVEWTIDTDRTASKATSTKGKKSVKVLTGTKKAITYMQVLTGSKSTSATLKIPRKNYYPNSRKKAITMVKLWRVKKATKVGSKWKLKASRITSQPLSEVNKAIKQRTIVQKSTLVTQTASPEGAVFYVSTKGKYTFKKKNYQPVVYGVGVRVQGWNAKSPHAAGKKVTDKNTVVWDSTVPTAATYRKFAFPKKPIVKSISVGAAANNHQLSFPIVDKHDDGKVWTERALTKVIVKVVKHYMDSSGSWKTSKAKAIINKLYSQTEITVHRDPSLDMPYSRTLLSMQPGEYLKYTVTAESRGIRGDSANPDPSKSLVIARPHDVTIDSIEKKNQHYNITFRLNADQGTRRTTGYTLQRLANYRPSQTGYLEPIDNWTDARWLDAVKAEPDGSWTDVITLGHIDNVTKQTFIDLVSNARADPFKRTYYRVVPFNNIEGLTGTPSDPVVVPGFLHIPTAADEDTSILSCSSTNNGNAIMAIVAFEKTKAGSYENPPDGEFYMSNGTEMSWDTFEQAWASSQPPSSYDFKDDVVPPVIISNEMRTSGDTAKLYSDVAEKWVTATYYLRGVQPSEKYYVKARRFLKDSETRESDSYGPLCSYSTEDGALKAVETVATTPLPQLSVPERLVEGKDLSVTWTMDTASEQKAYDIAAFQGTSDVARTNPLPLLSKEDSGPYAVIPANDALAKAMGPEGAKNQLFLAVKLRTDDKTWSDYSEIKTVPIVRAPKATIGDIPAVTDQPLSLTFNTTDNTASIIVRVVAAQLVSWGPMGVDNVADGSIVYSNKLSNVGWTDKGGGWYYYNYTLPTIDLKDGGDYTVEYTAVNDELGLDSNTVDENGDIVKATTSFKIAYSDTLTAPSFYVVVDPLDADISSKVRLTIPESSVNEGMQSAGCVVDIYRVTPDGTHLAFGNIAKWNGMTFVDRFPAYSRRTTCTYRVAVRNTNGQCEWSDKSYSLPAYSIRFDWGESDYESHDLYNHLVIPYNLKWSDNWTKSSRIDAHMDGTYEGYWRPNVNRKNTINTDIVKLTGAEQVARVKALARYAGPVLVRLPDGSIFTADVQVNNLDVSYDSLLVSASFAAQEIRMATKYTEGAFKDEPGEYRPER